MKRDETNDRVFEGVLSTVGSQNIYCLFGFILSFFFLKKNCNVTYNLPFFFVIYMKTTIFNQNMYFMADLKVTLNTTYITPLFVIILVFIKFYFL